MAWFVQFGVRKLDGTGASWIEDLGLRGFGFTSRLQGSSSFWFNQSSISDPER